MGVTKVLIANRGEIAVRVARACRELGIPSVAVYSDADAGGQHVLAADEAVRIGPAPASESYLRIDALIEAASQTGADAVHPGYGFLAENADFAAACREANLTFIGPSPEAIDAMGDKTSARARMVAAGVPVVPGSPGPVDDAAAAERAVADIGYPILLKAAAGGGGKGMRAVYEPAGLASALEAARREARQAFGDDRVYLERYLEAPRHVEIQVLADAGGRVIHLGERECSIQRRHQKLIEEAPSPAVDAELRRNMGAVACAAAQAVNYVGAGTVEFLLEGREFFFLEMNTRIQVEHPVTEMVAGFDLVQWQIRIACGELLESVESLIEPDGHAIECRISGEDPQHGFLPATGIVRELDLPAGPGVRWDGGIVPGDTVGLDYDPLLAKLIVHAPSRRLAIQRMKRALRELRIDGVRTTQPFHLAVMDEPDFQAGKLTIRYVEEHPELVEGDGRWEDTAALVAALLLEHQGAKTARGTGSPRARNGNADSGATGNPGRRSAERSAWQRALDTWS